MMTVTAKTPARDRIRALGTTSPKRRPRKAAEMATEAIDQLSQETQEEPVHETIVVPEAPAESVETDAASPSTSGRRNTKSDQVVQQLQTEGGASIAEIMAATSWQAHSVRGFFSAVVRKKLGLDLVSTVGEDGTRRYRISTAVAA